MPETSTITPADIRAYANLPSEVPEALLSKHTTIALRDLQRATGVMEPASDQVEDWKEALTVGALASVFSWLNTFALDGAAKVGRLEGSVEYRFLDAEDVEARITALNERFNTLVARITTDEPDTDDTGIVNAGFISLTAI